VDLPGEAVAGQPAQRRLVHHAVLAQEVEDRRLEAEVLHRVQHPAGAGHHAVAAALGQAAGEDLEHRAAVCGPRAQRGLHHGQLVVVGEQRGRGDGDRQPGGGVVPDVGPEAVPDLGPVRVRGGPGSVHVSTLHLISSV
jgi:hypothetical protein